MLNRSAICDIVVILAVDEQLISGRKALGTAVGDRG